MSGIKRSSYPSKQLRSGPAPLASFEDLSDEIESPEEPPPAEAADREPLELAVNGSEADDETKTYSDGVTPSTPRVLAQTPSTPLALEDFSVAGTPDSLGPVGEDEGADSLGPVGEDEGTDSRPGTPCRKESVGATSSSRSSIFSPRSSPLFGRRSKATTPDQQLGSAAATSGLVGKSMEFLNDAQGSGRKKPGSGSKSGPGTPSPRSARKFFTMSFFKPREDKTPSPPTSSPKSPRRVSPVSSPKSPGRRTSPFAGLFKSAAGTVKEALEGADPSASPTKKKGHFSHFLRVKDEKKAAADQGQGLGPVPSAAAAEPGRKEGRHGVLATLFRRADHRENSSAKPVVSSPLERSPSVESSDWPPPPFSSTAAVPGPQPDGTDLSDKDLSVAPPPIVTEQVDAASEASSAVDGRDPISPADGLLVGTQGIFESSQDIAGGTGIPVTYDPKLRLGSSPSAESAASFPPTTDAQAVPCSATTATVDRGRGELSVEEERLPSAAAASTASAVADKLSPESEAEIPEADPAVLKTLKKDEPEAETLLREDSFEADDFAAPDILQSLEDAGPVQGQQSPPQPLEKEVSKHRERLAAFRTNPVDRPRSTAPISFASLDAYISAVAPAKGKAGDGPDADKEKLKVVLPGEEFEHRSRGGSAKKALYKSWFEFCEVGLQSPRSRRRQVGDRLAPRTPSSAPASRETTIDEDERRAESLDFGSSDGWPATFEPLQANGHLVPPPPSEASGGCSEASSPTTAEQQKRYSNSSGSYSSGSSPRDPVRDDDDVVALFLRDEEVEPLVKEVDSVDDLTAGDGLAPMPDCVPPALDAGAALPVAPRRPPPPLPPLNGTPRPFWTGGVVDLLASLPSPPKRDRQDSWHADDCRPNENGGRCSSDSLAGSDGEDQLAVSGPVTSLPPLIPSKAEDT